MEYPFELVDLSDLESLARTTVDTLRMLPEELFYDDYLLAGLMDPIHSQANKSLGCWICKVIPSFSFGWSEDGQRDGIVGEGGGMFAGIFKEIEMIDMTLDPMLSQGLTEGLIPSLVFKTIETNVHDMTVANLYKRVAVPLVGIMVDIERVGIAG